MKIIFSVLFFLLCLGEAKAQNPAEEIANKIAQRMKDTLQLADSIKDKVYQINMQLNQQKMNVRMQYTGSDSLRIKIQQVESTRDGLYQAVIPTDKFYLYLQKKKNLVNNN